jgi:hypothetical protein
MKTRVKTGEVKWSMNEPEAKNWIDLGDWGPGMDEFKLPPSAGLIGQELTLHFNSSNLTIKYTFPSATFLTWEILEGMGAGKSDIETYEAIQVAPNIYFVDFVKKVQPEVSVSLALNLEARKATVLSATVPDRKEAGQGFIDRLSQGVDLSTVKVDIGHARVNPISPAEPVVPQERTSELIGKRIRYTYSHNHIYEHFYLNQRMFTWHCLKGREKGLADTEICDYFKIAPDIYLLIWREKVMPTYGVVVINLREMRSNGKTFGLDVASGKPVNFTMGALADPISETAL